MENLNIVYSSGPSTPTGNTPRLGLVGTANTGFYIINPGSPAQKALPGNKNAASLIQSNGEQISNAQLPYNPLPLGLNK